MELPARRKRTAFALAAVLALGLGSCAAEREPVQTAPAKPARPPEVYRAKFETSKGDFVIEVRREWAPRGADQFFELIWNKFYSGVRFHRVIRNYIVQFGINPDPKTQALWGGMRILDDPVRVSNKKGTITYAKLGPNSRSTQVFINLRDNPTLDEEGFAPFGLVVEGMDVVERLWSSYGEVAPRGTGPDPARIELEGEAYLENDFPRLDRIVRVTLVEPAPEAPAAAR